MKAQIHLIRRIQPGRDEDLVTTVPDLSIIDSSGTVVTLYEIVSLV